jgi:hypothetical protein
MPAFASDKMFYITFLEFSAAILLHVGTALADAFGTQA